MFQGLRRERKVSFEFSGIYFFSPGLDFLRNGVQSRLDMKEAVVGALDPQSALLHIPPSPELSLRRSFSPTLAAPLRTQGTAGLWGPVPCWKKASCQRCLPSAPKQPTNCQADPGLVGEVKSWGFSH